MYANQTALRFKSSNAIEKPQATAPTNRLSLIWTRGIDQKNETSVLNDTLEADGVISARYTCKTPYILLINYNPRITCHEQIQQIYYKSMGTDAIEFVHRQ